MTRTTTAILAAGLSVATATGPLAAVALYLGARLALHVYRLARSVQQARGVAQAQTMADEMVRITAQLRAPR